MAQGPQFKPQYYKEEREENYLSSTFCSTQAFSRWMEMDGASLGQRESSLHHQLK
jgi:hypothetical protein